MTPHYERLKEVAKGACCISTISTAIHNFNHGQSASSRANINHFDRPFTHFGSFSCDLAVVTINTRREQESNIFQ